MRDEQGGFLEIKWLCGVGISSKRERELYRCKEDCIQHLCIWKKHMSQLTESVSGGEGSESREGVDENKFSRC